MITLKAARVNKGLTQSEAAQLLNISPSTLLKYEKGKTFPDVAVLKRIEQLYDVTYNDIDFFCDKKTV